MASVTYPGEKTVETARTQTQTTSAAGRLAELWTMPLAFLGFALWRAWVSLSYAAPVFALPSQAPTGGKLVYDLCLAAAAVALALGSRGIVPLNGRRWAYGGCWLLMTASTAIQVAGLYMEIGTALYVVRDVLAGAGSALMILLWCEVYACLSSIRVAVYLSLSFILGVLVTFVLEGLRPAYLQGAMLALPGLALVCVYRSYTLYVEPTDRPQPSESRFVPWRVFVLLALYGVLEGLCAVRVGDAYVRLVGSHATWATLVGSVVLFVCAYYLSDRFDFSRLYRAPAALAICGLLFIPLFGFGGSVVGAFCVSVSATLFGCLVFLLLCDLSRRTGTAAVWLFGLEEAMVLFGHVGKALDSLLFEGGALGPYADSLVSVVGVAVVVVFTAVCLVGLHRTGGGVEGLDGRGPQSELSDQERILAACNAVARERGLSPRETEVLRLLAQGKSLSGVARELFIAEGTAKAHTQHIYEKVGVSRRSELLELVEGRAEVGAARGLS